MGQGIGDHTSYDIIKVLKPSACQPFVSNCNNNKSKNENKV